MKATTLKEIKTAIRKIERKKEKLRETKKSLYSELSQAYKKFDWQQDYIECRDLQQMSPNTAIGVQRKARELKKIKVVKKAQGTSYYSKTNIQGLFLLQEMMCYVDDEYWYKQPKAKTKIKYIPYYFDSKYLGRCYICSHPSTTKWKQDLVTEFLQDKHYIFDESNQFGKPLKEIRNFIHKSLIKSSVEKWDYHFQRFLAKKD